MTLTRISDPSDLPHDEVHLILGQGNTPVVQFSKPVYTEKMLRELDGLCHEFGERIELRFYGHYTTGFDAEALGYLPHVRNLSVDCLTKISGVESLYSLAELKKLSFGVYDFDEPDLIAKLNLGHLRTLTVSETRKKNIHIAPIAAAARLERLYIVGHTHGIDAIAQLPRLNSLVLSQFPKKQKLGFIAGCQSLLELELILGGRENIDEVESTSIESLSVVRIRGLNSLGELNRFPALKHLRLEDQIQLQSFSLSGVHLERLTVANCKHLGEIDHLLTIETLQEFRASRTSLDLESLKTAEWPKSLRVLALYSGSSKWNQECRQLLDARGYSEWSPQAGI